jgi:hypothetical protein
MAAEGTDASRRPAAEDLARGWDCASSLAMPSSMPARAAPWIRTPAKITTEARPVQELMAFADAVLRLLATGVPTRDSMAQAPARIAPTTEPIHAWPSIA